MDQDEAREKRIQEWVDAKHIAPTERAARRDLVYCVKHGGEAKNRDASHARQHVGYLFVQSNLKIFALTNKLSIDVWGDSAVVAEAVNFLDRGGNLQILVEDNEQTWDALAEHPLIDAIRHYFYDGCASIHSLPQDNQDHDHNFAVGDRSIVRYEATRNMISAVTSKSSHAELYANEFEALTLNQCDISGQPNPIPTMRVRTERCGDHYVAIGELPGLAADLEDLSDCNIRDVATSASAIEGIRTGKAVRYHAHIEGEFIILTLHQ